MSNYMEAFYLYHFILCPITAGSKEACFQTSKMMGSSVSLLVTYSFKVCMGLVTPYMEHKMLATPALLKEMKCSKKCHEEKTCTSSTKWSPETNFATVWSVYLFRTWPCKTTCIPTTVWISESSKIEIWHQPSYQIFRLNPKANYGTWGGIISMNIA
jgi:hypothetical protein